NFVDGIGTVTFFFSSRRRHTRLQGDWSSDVCSSDLHVGGVRGPLAHLVLLLADGHAGRGAVDDEAGDALVALAALEAREGQVERSEERRVGKECRSRWGRCQLKKKDQDVRDSLTGGE